MDALGFIPGDDRGEANLVEAGEEGEGGKDNRGNHPFPLVEDREHRGCRLWLLLLVVSLLRLLRLGDGEVLRSARDIASPGGVAQVGAGDDRRPVVSWSHLGGAVCDAAAAARIGTDCGDDLFFRGPPR